MGSYQKKITQVNRRSQVCVSAKISSLDLKPVLCNSFPYVRAWDMGDGATIEGVFACHTLLARLFSGLSFWSKLLG